MVTRLFPIRFDGESNNCLSFVEHVLERATKLGWNQMAISIIGIPIGPPIVLDVCNVVEDYARVTIREVKAVAMTYTSNYIGAE